MPTRPPPKEAPSKKVHVLMCETQSGDEILDYFGIVCATRERAQEELKRILDLWPSASDPDDLQFSDEEIEGFVERAVHERVSVVPGTTYWICEDDVLE